MVKNVLNAVNTITRTLPEDFSSPRFEKAKVLLINDLAYAPPEMENYYWAALAQLCNDYLPRPVEGKVWEEIKDMIWKGLRNSYDEDSDDEPGDVQSD